MKVNKIDAQLRGVEKAGVFQSSQKIYWLFFSAAIIAAIAFSAPQARAALANVFWTESFESYPSGPIHGRASTWQRSGGTADVTNSRAHTGTQCLELQQYSTDWSGARWYDDMSFPPHDGLVELDWWMYRSVASTWEFKVGAWNGEEIARLANHKAGSIGTVDVKTQTGWLETMAFATEGSWLHLFLDIDFDSSPTPYRFSISTTDTPGTWFGWYSLGATGDYFRCLYFNIGYNMPDVFWDDLTASSTNIPEPATVCLLGLGALSLTVRKKHLSGRN
jgi:hypothetical protein